MTWDATWWWLVAYLIVGFIVAVAAVRSPVWREDPDDVLAAVGTWLGWPVMVAVGLVYGVGVLIVTLGRRR